MIRIKYLFMVTPRRKRNIVSGQPNQAILCLVSISFEVSEMIQNAKNILGTDGVVVCDVS